MMRTFHRVLLTAAAIAVLAGGAPAAPAAKKAPPAKPKSAPPAKPKIDLLNMLGAGDILGVGDMAPAAADLRKAAEAFERFGNALKTIVPTATKGLAEGSRNLSNMGQAIDPLGLKAALTIIREQNQTIQALQQAEIRRLKEELQRLRKAPARRPGKTKARKKGRK